jgi:hypothetical protein
MGEQRHRCYGGRIPFKCHPPGVRLGNYEGHFASVTKSQGVGILVVMFVPEAREGERGTERPAGKGKAKTLPGVNRNQHRPTPASLSRSHGA